MAASVALLPRIEQDEVEKNINGVDRREDVAYNLKVWNREMCVSNE